MHSRDDRGIQQPFGKRRPAPESRDRERADRVGSPLPWALRVTGLVGLLAVLAAAQLARWSDLGAPPTRVAIDARRVSEDPETTGSIAGAKAAQATQLNPCLAPGAGPLRP